MRCLLDINMNKERTICIVKVAIYGSYQTKGEFEEAVDFLLWTSPEKDRTNKDYQV